MAIIIKKSKWTTFYSVDLEVVLPENATMEEARSALWAMFNELSKKDVYDLIEWVGEVEKEDDVWVNAATQEEVSQEEVDKIKNRSN